MLKKTSLIQKTTLILFGLFLTVIILETGLRIGGFTILSMQEHRNLQSIKQKGLFRIMCLGESTTQGQYPPYLEEILNQRNIGIKFSVIDKGISCTNIAAILAQLELNLNKYHPDAVVAMMGINDGGSHMPHEVSSASKTMSILKSFKAYKLVRFLWLHIETKFKEVSKRQNYAQVGQSFKKAVELNPNNDSAYIDLGWFYHSQGKFAEAEQSLKQAIELNPNNDTAYRKLGKVYIYKGQFAESEQLLKKAIELNPNNDSAYIDLGWLYQFQGKFAGVGQSFKKAVELNPNNDSAYIDLGWFYHSQGKFAEAEQSLKQAIELNPNNDVAYRELGKAYIYKGQFAESEEAFNKAIELNPNNDSAYIDLGWLYHSQGKFAEAEQSLKQAIELNPNNERLYGSLAMIYCNAGNKELFKKYTKKADSLRNEYPHPEAYRMLKRILDKRKIRLVCVQYPVRNIEPLKKIFKEETEDSIIFVDNEKIFKDAIRKEGYKEYFRDMFGGDFGHCTDKGNRLLAENIANGILKEMFGK